MHRIDHPENSLGAPKMGANGSTTANGFSHAMDENKDDEISLKEIVEILLKGKWIILSSFAVVLLLSALYTFTSDPEYEAASIVYINDQQSGMGLGDMLGLPGDNRNVANEVEILKSRAIAERVARRLMAQPRLKGGNQPSVLAADEDAEKVLTETDVAERLRKRFIQIKPVGREVDFIEITATSVEPEESALIANLYATEYVDYNRTASRMRMTESKDFLSEVTDQFSDSLQKTERDLTAFLNQASVVAPDEQAKQLLEQISKLQQLQYETQLQLGVAQAELSGLRREVEQAKPGLDEQISSDDDVIIDRFKQQIAELQIEENRFYATNPGRNFATSPDQKLTNIRAEIRSLTQKMNERVASLVERALSNKSLQIGGSNLTGAGGGATAHLVPLSEAQRKITETNILISGLEARQRLVNDELARYTNQFQDIPNKAIILKRLERASDTSEQLYLALVTRLQEAKIAERSELGYVEIIDDAREPDLPVRPRIPLNLMLGAILGLMLGVGLAFARNALDNKVRKPEDVKKLGLPILGVIADMRAALRADFGTSDRVTLEGQSYATVLISLLNPLSPMAEAYRRLRTSIQFSRPDTVVQTVMVTSSGPGEGKSVTAMNLALTMAQTGRRTVYIDADLRRPTGHRLFGVPREPGLVDLLFDKVDVDATLFSTSVDNFFFVPTGKDVPNPAELLGSRKMRELLVRLRNEFDVIVVDTPPVLIVTDALLVSTQCDATVVVVSAGEADIPAVQRTYEALREVGARVIGAVLNRYDPKSSHGYGYGYGYGYGGYYSTEKPADRRPVTTARSEKDLLES